MNLAQKFPSVSEILDKHVTLETEGIDRMYLNVYVPQLQSEQGAASFFIHHRGHRIASTVLMAPMSKAFIESIDKFVSIHHLPMVNFEKGQRKDDIAKEYFAKFQSQEGVVFVGKAQEKAYVLRTEKRRNPVTGQPYPWLTKSTAMVNHFYFYCLDKNFGPFFLKFCSYFPYNAKLCLNGHEYTKRQLTREGIAFEALDNGILSCENPQRLQKICDDLSPLKIDSLLRKWLRLLPHPFTVADKKEGYRYDLSILQSEFSLTQVLDRPLTGRIFFEEVIRENLDIGRPDHVQLIFGRRVTKRTPGSFRTRIITEGVTPSLHFDYKTTRVKQYHKEGRALRTETTINNTRDFAIGKRLKNLCALRKIGFEANRRLLDVQKISHDCSIGEDTVTKINQSVDVNGQRAPGLRFFNGRVQALFHTLTVFRLLPNGFANNDMRRHVASLLGQSIDWATQGKMTYDLRRLRLHGLIERIPKTHRYQVTPLGLRVAMFVSRTYTHLLRPGLSLALSETPEIPGAIRDRFNALETSLQQLIHQTIMTN